MMSANIRVEVARLNSDDGHPLWSACVEGWYQIRTDRDRMAAIEKATKVYLDTIGVKNPTVKVPAQS